MASAIVRSSLRAALRGGARQNPASKRSFSSGASADEEARTILLSLLLPTILYMMFKCIFVA